MKQHKINLPLTNCLRIFFFQEYVKWRTPPEQTNDVLGPVGPSWVPTISHGIPLGPVGSAWGPMGSMFGSTRGPMGFPWVPMSSHGCPQMLRFSGTWNLSIGAPSNTKKHKSTKDGHSLSGVILWGTQRLWFLAENTLCKL